MVAQSILYRNLSYSASELLPDPDAVHNRFI